MKINISSRPHFFLLISKVIIIFYNNKEEAITYYNNIWEKYPNYHLKKIVGTYSESNMTEVWTMFSNTLNLKVVGTRKIKKTKQTI